jgi:poly(beta-D-mannuronate) lyase
MINTLVNGDMMITLQAHAAADAIKPLVVIEQPVSGSKVSEGSITVKGRTSDNSGGSGVQRVELSVDGEAFKIAKPKTTGDWSTWSISITLTNVGSHEIKAKATDNAGNKDWDTITVSLDAVSITNIRDDSDPVISITYPSDGDTIAPASSVIVRGTARDSGGSGIDNVWVRLDSGRYYPVTPSAANDWSTWTVPLAITTAGTHTLTAKARDNSDNDNWDTITIKVQTGVAPLLPSPRPAPDDMPDPVRTINVASIAEMMSAIRNARAGDHIILQSGRYDTAQYFSSNHVNRLLVTADGTASSPIVIRAESAGSVEIAGPASFHLKGSQNVVIHGFKFIHSQDNSAPTDDMAIMCDDCQNVRFAYNTFALTTSYGGSSSEVDRYHSDWLGFSGSGSNNRVDHNEFKNKSTRGVFLFLFGENGKVVQNTRVDHNTFSGQSFRHGNGGECFRIGNSALGPSPGNMLMEYNTFEKCNGDREALTIKSSNNIIRYNTFRNNEGSLTFRHGNANTADGNVFIGGNNGIRAYGHDHKIINNYFADNPVSVSSLLGPIVLGRGTILNDLTSSNSEHSQPRNILIAHNTFANNRANLIIGYGSGSYLPDDITVGNNIVTGSSGELVQVYAGDVVFRNNIIYPTGSAIAGDLPTSGYKNLNPQLISSGSIMRPLKTSPAVDTLDASATYGVIKDIDGQTRSGQRDIGADEV